jgi:hypothetical protein
MNKLTLAIVLPVAVVSIILSVALLMKFKTNTQPSVSSVEQIDYALDTSVTRPSGSLGASSSGTSSFEMEIQETADDGGQADIDELSQDASAL